MNIKGYSRWVTVQKFRIKYQCQNRTENTTTKVININCISFVQMEHVYS